jgi:hypothetical protein
VHQVKATKTKEKAIQATSHRSFEVAPKKIIAK